jgi:hypothetical protein
MEGGTFDPATASASAHFWAGAFTGGAGVERVSVTGPMFGRTFNGGDGNDSVPRPRRRLPRGGRPPHLAVSAST